jgi:hypothetical protein
MPKEGQKTVTLSGEALKMLGRYYKEELNRSMYRISFAEFTTKHAIRDLQREGGEIHPAKDLIYRVIDLQRRLEDFRPNVRNNVHVLKEYDIAMSKVTDARTAIMALVAEFNKAFPSTDMKMKK